MANLTFEEQVQRIKDYNEVWNLAIHLYSAEPGESPWNAVMNRLALDTPGVRVEMNWGVYEGKAGMERLYPGLHNFFTQPSKPEDAPGAIALMDFAPVIEIAGDGKTAKLLLDCLGFETWPWQGKMTAFWTIGKRGYDFIKENGEWKIWHYHVYGAYFAPYDEGWISGYDHIDYPGVKIYPPDRPPTTYNDTWYKPERAYIDQPAPPAPYYTFDENTAY